MDYRIELVSVPVTDVDRARDFYVNQVGFVLDHDGSVGADIRFVQLTPPGSACSIVLGRGITRMEPGTQLGLQMVVADIEQAQRELRGRGVQISDIDDQQWGRFLYFSDPDGNGWAIQQLPDYSSATWQEAQKDIIDNRPV